MIDTVTQNNVRLLVGHHRRFSPYVESARTMIQGGVAASGIYSEDGHCTGRSTHQAAEALLQSGDRKSETSNQRSRRSTDVTGRPGGSRIRGNPSTGQHKPLAVYRSITQRLFYSSGVVVCFNASSMQRFRLYAQTIFPYRRFR